MSAQFATMFQKPFSPDGGLPEDGQYYGYVADAAFRENDKGFYFFDFTLTVDEGEYEGESVEATVVLVNPNNPDNENGAKTLKTYMHRANPDLLNLDPSRAQDAFLQELIGRRVQFTQKTNISDKNGKTYVNHYINEVFCIESSPQYGAQEAETPATPSQHPALMTEDDIPF